MDIVTYAAAKKGAAASAVKAVETRLGDISTNVTFKGSVATIEDLPSSATAGDEYAVGNQGLYVWNGTNWVPVSRAGIQGEPGEKGDAGESGVYIGNTEPIDPDIKVWFNPDGAPDPDDVMLAGNYDADGAVADAGGIAAYVESHGSSDSLWEAGTGENSIMAKNSSGCQANGLYSTAKGFNTRADGDYSHVEGFAAITVNSEIEGWQEGSCAHAEGLNTTAGGNYSHAEGAETVTNNVSEHAEGQYNVSHMANQVWGNAGNTIHSVGVGTESDRKNAIEIMQNGDIYMTGVGGYNGTNPSGAASVQSVINSGGASGLITVARNVSLIYDTTAEEETDHFFYATVPVTSFPSDFLTLGKYNLIVVITGEEDSTQVGYTANHFCYLNSDGFFMGRCIDEYSNESLYHYTAIESTENGYQIVYQGIMGEGKVLPDEGSKVSVYLQQLF